MMQKSSQRGESGVYCRSPQNAKSGILAHSIQVTNQGEYLCSLLCVLQFSPCCLPELYSLKMGLYYTNDDSLFAPNTVSGSQKRFVAQSPDEAPEQCSAERMYSAMAESRGFLRTPVEASRTKHACARLIATLSNRVPSG
jgi:hypothetical protein